MPPNLLVFGGRGWEKAGHVGYGAHADGKSNPKLLDQVRDAIRRKHYSLRIEGAYLAEI